MRKPLPVWALVSAAWVAPAILAAFQAYAEMRWGNWTDGTWRDIAFQGADWLLYALLTPIVFALGRRFPLHRDRLTRAVPIHFAASIGLCLAWAAGGTLLRHLLFPPGNQSLARELAGWFLTSLPFGVAVYFAVLGVAHAAAYFLEAREAATRSALLSAQLAEARLDALRMQLQPHFLFNSLNAIAVIIRDRDTTTASRMVEQLGEMLRRVMRSDRPQEVTLAEELAFVRQFLAIEEIRFSDRLRPVFDIQAGLEGAAVPEFLLQPLVENALRHGLAKRETATLLRIQARRVGDDLILRVIDDGPGPETPGGTPPEGVGLGNTRARLATLYGERASLTLAPLPTGGAATEVRLPYHELEAAHG